MIKKLFVLATALVFSSCNYRIDKKEAAAGAEDKSLATAADDISFQMVTQKILQTKCLSCHSNVGGNKGGVNLETYQSVFQERDTIRSEILSGDMPKSPVSPLTAAQIQFITRWIDNGALEFANQHAPPTAPPVTEPPVVVTPPPTGPTEPLTFANVMKKVIEPKCLKCHGADTTTDVQLLNYADVAGNLIDIKDDVMTGRMPRRSSLTLEQKKLILDWINVGAKEI